MSVEFDKVIDLTEKSQEKATGVVERLFEVARPGSVYAEPVVAGEHTLITASEVSVALGYGFGTGGGQGRTGPERGMGGDESEEEGEGSGVGGGGGGGGVSLARPVAVISVGPEGVRVEPVVDPTKIAIALFTTLGSMFFMLSRMRRAR